jgi:hypothetical protein
MGKRECCFKIGNHKSASRAKVLVPCYNDIVATIERLLEGLKRPAPHDERLVHCDAPKRLQIGGNMPWQTAPRSDGAVFRNGDNQCDRRATHTATFAAI